MNVYESFVNRCEKEFYGRIIDDISSSDQFNTILQLYVNNSRICLSKASINLYETNSDDIVSFIVNISRQKYFNLTKIMQNLKTCLTAYRQLKENSILDEIIICLTISLFGTTLTCKYPSYALKEDIGKIIWKEVCLKSLNKIKSLLKSMPENKRSEILEICDKYLEKLSLIYFTILLLSIHFLKSSVVPPNERKYVMYWSSFYSATLGDISNFQKQILMKKENVKRCDRVSTCFYMLANKIWPQYSKPYHNLALLYLSYGNHFTAIYFYALLFMNITTEDCFTLARQDFGEIYSAVEKECKKFNIELSTHKYLTCIDLFKPNEENSLLLFNNNNKMFIFCLRNQKKITQIKKYQSKWIEMSLPTNQDKISSFAKLLVNSICSNFIFLNLKIMMKYNMDAFQSELQHFSRLISLLLDFDNKHLSVFFNKLLYFPIILVFTINISFNDSFPHKLDSAHDDPNYIAVTSSLKLLLLFTDFVIKLLTKHDVEAVKNGSTCRQALFYLTIILKWLQISSNLFPTIKRILPALILDGDQYCFIDLYNWITIDLTNQATVDYSLLPELNIFNAAIFHKSAADAASSIPIPDSVITLNLEDVNNVPSTTYLTFIKSTIASLISENIILFKIENDHAFFDEKYFIKFQEAKNMIEIDTDSILKFSEFSVLLGSITDFKALFFLYNFVMNAESNKIDSSIHYIRLIAPDTNTFLEESLTILDLHLFDKMNIIIPILVIRELMGLNDEKRTEKNSDASHPNSTRALKSYNSIIYKKQHNKNIQFLTTEGTFTDNISYSISEYNEKFKRFDDIILSSVKQYYDKTTRSIPCGKNQFKLRSLLFVTNDLVLATKALSCDVLCLSLKLLKEISIAIN